MRWGKISRKISIMIALSLVALLTLFACTTQQTRTADLPRQDLPIKSADNTAQATAQIAAAPEPTAPAAQDSSAAQAASPTAPAAATTKEFTMTAKQFEFIPSTIEVNKGDTVVLKITSIDVKHGISLPGFNVDEDLNPGQETIVTFVADKTGTFDFSCSIMCGSGHGEMAGQLIVS